jgi:hypothetical protein
VWCVLRLPCFPDSRTDILASRLFSVGITDHPCANRVATGAAVGGALGASIGELAHNDTPHSASATPVGGVFGAPKQIVLCWLSPRSNSDAGAMYGTYEAFRYKVPGIYKIRYIGQTTLSSAAVRHVSL